ncbi:molybdopterin-dependent oxidoreductase [Paenibacillus radicis (ex Xue et al. 2023)]|uniref:Molybdopterin-dependent oxidoreductase n=1 Tax=Paenibacillus radicis (ex Xue et al. 2023) TaxID=2972489 RepID=A0ABT1YLH1_9BACL|nr:molybdopterin-dependent oxidoreductase [Paenibacillus radicis (ex Xue et al. 2023)]MCR8633254.1 molybdopterin-dependent oxidoreductase [Paenibacillus radicis (ex Xue et al. 2023)]
MDSWRGWLKESYGKKLSKLHAWNAWIIVLLAVTGIILYIPSIRGDLGAFRVFMKQAHIVIGFLSILVIAMYVPLIPKHWKQIRNKLNQRWNLIIVLGLLVGWSVTGLILWQFRSLPPIWSNLSLVLHDLFTWVGIPYAAYHSISRSRWLKSMRSQEIKAALAQAEASMELEKKVAAASSGAEVEGRMAPQAFVEYLKKTPISRANFLRLVAGLVLVFGVGPAFYRWMKSVSDTGGEELDKLVDNDGNHMLPAPVALAESNPPIGGGGKGEFRIYTVTDIPSFSSDNWQFVISGLVDKPISWSWEELLKLPRKVQVSDFHCVTGWSVYSLTWEGIPLSDLLKIAGVKSKARFAKMYSGDKVYTDCLSLEQARLEDVMVAILMDGKPLPQQLGGPVRLVVPKMYAYKSVKWLQAIELIEEEHMGYWEVRGYDNDAWVPGKRHT